MSSDAGESIRSQVWRQARRFLIVRLDNIGDVVMTGPALRAIRLAAPGAHLTLLASPAGAQIAPLLPWVDEVWPWRAIWQDLKGDLGLDPARELAFIEQLRQGHFNAVVILTSFSQSPHPVAYAAYLAGIPLRLGHSKEFGGFVLSDWVRPPADSTHQVDRNLALVQAVGFSEAGRHLELSLPLDAVQAARSFRAQAGLDPAAPYIALVPGASCAARRYDPERYAQAAALLYAQTRLPILVLGSPKEAALWPPFDGLAGVISLIGRTTVPELTALIAQAALVIANDSAAMHLADAFQRPMVILYSGTELESQWQPRAAPARLLRRETACQPCYRFQCPYQMECLDIPSAEVVAAGRDLLEDVARSAAWLPERMQSAC